ncbi:hypothetical protein [Nannocystis pusilla]|uniref:Lipoprotein n=1 Tax=Nannocystis pusilla TaxID=889268 RepID=A0ABS7TM15_9BACT|nr:hypothetical protein [Nannocystis pusilla]MBZ5709260.1 hypothetical protein [Nannocystis pusilla]
MALAIACGDDVGDQTGTGSTSGATSEVTDPTEPTSGGAGDVCEDPSDVGIGPVVAVHLRNDGDANIFVEALSGCPGATPYDLRDANDAVVQSKSDVCPASCRNVLENGGCECSNVGVCPVSVVRIAPGGVYDSAWSGAVHGTAMLPATCLPDGCEATSCQIEEQAPAGTYTLASRYSKSIPCSPDLCSCEASSEGWCIIAETNGLRLGPTEPPVEVTFSYPDTTDVTLVLE